MRARHLALALVACALLLVIPAVFADAAADLGDTGTSNSAQKQRREKNPARPPRPVFVDDCDACASAGYALFDAMAYQQAVMRGKLGRDTRLADVVGYAKYVDAAVDSACAKRGHWLRFTSRSVLDPGSKKAFLVLSGPGTDADASVGMTRPDDNDRIVDLSEALRARCVEEATRVGTKWMAIAFNDTDVDGSEVRDEEDDFDDFDDDETSSIDDGSRTKNKNDQDFEENAAAFAFALCVDKTRAKQAKVNAPPCVGSEIARKARRVMAAAAAETEKVEKIASDDAALSETTRKCADEMPRLVNTTAQVVNHGSLSTTTDPSFGLSDADSMFWRTCLTASAAAVKKGDDFARAASSTKSGSGAGGNETLLREALRWYAAAEASAPYGSPEFVAAVTRAARVLVAEHLGFDDDEKTGDDDDAVHTEATAITVSASSAYGLDSVSLPKRAARLKLALAAAARASESRRFDPAPRLVTADLLAISGDHEGAFDEYAEALFYLPYAGEVSAAVTSSAAQTAAAAARRLAGFVLAMKQALDAAADEFVSADDSGVDAEDAKSDTTKPPPGATRLSSTRVKEIETSLALAKQMAIARAKESAMNALEALVMSPSRARHAALAAATLAHASVNDGRWEDALNAGNIAARCDERRPPKECHAVFLAHAKALMAMDLWALAREGAHLAVTSKGEKGNEAREASVLASEAERKMDAVADEAFMEKSLGADWRKRLMWDTERESDGPGSDRYEL